MSAHTMEDLYQMQGLPLSIKIRLTQERIRAWVETYDLDGVYISFSGGKDSTVLLDIARKMYPEIKAVFVDTGLEYPEIRGFVKGFENVDWLKPKMNFKQVIEKYGYPFISKEVSECVEGARKYLTALLESGSLERTNERIPYRYFYNRVTGRENYARKKNPPRYSELAEAAHLEAVRGGRRHCYNYECDRLFGTLSGRTKPADGQPRGRQQSKAGDNVRDVDKGQRDTDKGEYP